MWTLFAYQCIKLIHKIHTLRNYQVSCDRYHVQVLVLATNNKYIYDFICWREKKKTGRSRQQEYIFIFMLAMNVFCLCKMSLLLHLNVNINMRHVRKKMHFSVYFIIIIFIISNNVINIIRDNRLYLFLFFDNKIIKYIIVAGSLILTFFV